jgi:hypothetical protein
METQLSDKIKDALKAFRNGAFHDKAISLLATLGYQSDKTLDLGGSPAAFLDQFGKNEQAFNKKKALFDEWKSIDFLFQLTDDELSRQSSLFDNNKVNPGLLQSYLFFAVELTGDNYARGKLTDLARQINRLFPTPVMVLIKHLEDKQPVLSIAVINRRQNKQDANKDVLGKVTIIRNISLVEPHRGHIDILHSFALENLTHPQHIPISSFDTLHAAWENVFNVKLLNERFYKEIRNWFYWARLNVTFPSGATKDAENRDSEALIRLLTRLIFCWFIKEKKFIPEDLFSPTKVCTLLTNWSPSDKDTEGRYYLAILQNLFFATLATPSNERRFREARSYQGKNKHYGDQRYFRHVKLFQVKAPVEDLYKKIPFLNGGLFENLDEFPSEDNDLKEENRVDGFSDTPSKQPCVPDFLFFGDTHEVAELSAILGEKSPKTRGLLNIFCDYKFTIEENTPLEEEIALDPELLGRVFENLLAAVNPETGATIRKSTGSFYTPREIVDYMAAESLTRWLLTTLSLNIHDQYLGEKLRGLVSFESPPIHSRLLRPI